MRHGALHITYMQYNMFNYGSRLQWRFSFRFQCVRKMINGSVTGSTFSVVTSTVSPYMSPQNVRLYCCHVENDYISMSKSTGDADTMPFQHHGYSPSSPPLWNAHCLTRWKHFQILFQPRTKMSGDSQSGSQIYSRCSIGKASLTHHTVLSNGQLAARTHVTQTSPARPASPQGRSQSLGEHWHQSSRWWQNYGPSLLIQQRRCPLLKECLQGFCHLLLQVFFIEMFPLSNSVFDAAGSLHSNICLFSNCSQGPKVALQLPTV